MLKRDTVLESLHFKWLLPSELPDVLHGRKNVLKLQQGLTKADLMDAWRSLFICNAALSSGGITHPGVNLCVLLGD